MTTYKYLGYGVTDENGVAHLDHDANGDPLTHSYTGVGAGEIDVLASLDNPITSSSIVSETLIKFLFARNFCLRLLTRKINIGIKIVQVKILSRFIRGDAHNG